MKFDKVPSDYGMPIAHAKDSGLGLSRYAQKGPFAMG